MSNLKDLMAKGREQGYLLRSEVLEILPDEITDEEQIEDILQLIEDMKIKIYETKPNNV